MESDNERDNYNPYRSVIFLVLVTFAYFAVGLLMNISRYDLFYKMNDSIFY